ncbi:MAG TPA: NAD(P)/FAD-dependent oxidoreductase [Clostridiales bacterium]|nr:NAD(P)/FAD-dependent oxidoreductase [Clostridiales bacterium]
MGHDVVIVGGGMAGLTAAAYLCRAGLKVLLCEKEVKTGGLVNSFDYHGFTFDGGIRAIENSGIVNPMLRQLGIDVPFVRNGVSVGIENDVVNLQSKDSLTDYLQLLHSHFPDNSSDIAQFGLEIKKIMQYMDVLYGIDNPLFLDLKKDKKYLVQTILPWMIKYILTIRKVMRLDLPVVKYLKMISDNTALIDMIAQHFFKDTPTFFALSYFSLYLDYQYPCGGTGILAEKMRQYILEHHGEIKCETEISRLDPSLDQIQDTKGNIYAYKKLIWTSDLKRLYQIIDIEAVKNTKSRKAIAARKDFLSDKVGGDSVLTLYLMVDMNKEYFASIASAHFFYTPLKTGLSRLEPFASEIQGPKQEATGKSYVADRQALQNWLKEFYRGTTYEISCPVIRDASLAPEGKTGLIISTLFDHSLVKHISDAGGYDDFKEFSARQIIDVLSEKIYPGMKEKVIDHFISTPLTLEKLTGNSDGAITGWAFTNSSMPAVHSLPKVAGSVLTPIPNVYQAGQWTFSPSGLPISILTGKLAADKVINKLK